MFSSFEKTPKERMLYSKDLALAQAVDMCQAAEITKEEIQSMCSRQYTAITDKSVDAYKRSNPGHHSHQSGTCHRTYETDEHQSSSPRTSKYQSKSSCGRCGCMQSPDCLAWGQKCRICVGIGIILPRSVVVKTHARKK